MLADFFFPFSSSDFHHIFQFPYSSKWTHARISITLIDLMHYFMAILVELIRLVVIKTLLLLLLFQHLYATIWLNLPHQVQKTIYAWRTGFFFCKMRLAHPSPVHWPNYTLCQPIAHCTNLKINFMLQRALFYINFVLSTLQKSDFLKHLAIKIVAKKRFLKHLRNFVKTGKNTRLKKKLLFFFFVFIEYSHCLFFTW